MNDAVIANRAQSPAPTKLSERLGIMDIFMPRSRVELLDTCKMFSQSSICPKGMKGDAMAVLACLEVGERFGLTLLASVQNIAFINGKMTMWGDLMIAIARSFPLCDSIHEEFTGTLEAGTLMARCTVKRKGEEHPIVQEWSVEEAKKANLWNKDGPWRTYPKRMLQMRARGFALRDAFPDALGGIITREEAEDYAIDAQTQQKVDKPTGPIMDAATGEVTLALESPPAKSVEMSNFIERCDLAANQEQLDMMTEAAAVFTGDELVLARKVWFQNKLRIERETKGEQQGTAGFVQKRRAAQEAEEKIPGDEAKPSEYESKGDETNGPSNQGAQ